MSLLRSLFGGAKSDVDPAAADQLVRDGALLVDVREKREWDAGHAPAAKHIPLGTLGGKLHTLPKDRTIVVVCRSGNRSGRATRMLVDAGYDAHNLHGGMMAWHAAGLPMRASGRGKATVA